MIGNEFPNDEVEEFVIGLFVDINPEKNLEAANMMQLDYFAAELIDSFGTIEMVGAIEDKFNINFDYNDFENPDFKIIEGLISIIRSKTS